MSVAWPDLLRSIVDGKYFLKQFVREEAETGLFLAEDPRRTQVDVYLVAEQNGRAQEWSDRASRSAALSHPNILRDVAAGETRIDGTQYSFLATEHVQEYLQEVVRDRKLSPDEAMVVTEGLLGALIHLHLKGYSHGRITVDQIVAANDSVKLIVPTVIPLPSDNLESRRAVTADLRELGETVTEILTGKRELEASAQLPAPFRDFVRASFGTEECPSPTASQLLGVLHGKPLPAVRKAPAKPSEPEPVSTPSPIPVSVAEPISEPVSEPTREVVVDESVSEREPPRLEVVPPPDLSATEPVRFKPATAVLAMTAVAVIALAIFGYQWITSEPKREDGDRTRVTEPPPAVETPRPSPVSPTSASTVSPAPKPAAGKPAAAKAPAAKPPAVSQPAAPKAASRASASSTDGTQKWAVIAATYRNYDAAAKRAASLKSSWKNEISVYPEKGQGEHYFVVLGRASSPREADRLLGQARRSGMPRDAYVTRMSF